MFSFYFNFFVAQHLGITLKELATMLSMVQSFGNSEFQGLENKCCF